MTILNCPVCGGTHYGSHTCPMRPVFGSEIGDLVDVTRTVPGDGISQEGLHVHYAAGSPFTFSEAIMFLKSGQRVGRQGWNGKGMYLQLVPARRNDKRLRMELAYIEMSTAQGDLVPWLASQTDMLAEDWVLA